MPKCATKAGTIPPHASSRRACEHAGCEVREFSEAMVKVESGAWFCPNHALLLAARDLVAFYRADDEADWTAISEIIGEQLPEIVKKVEAFHPFRLQRRT